MLPPPLLPRAVALHVLRSLARRDRRKLPSGMRGLDGTLGLPEAGRLDAAALERVLARSVAAGGTRELVCHPGSDAGALQAHYTSWRYRWEQERDALSQPGLRARLATRVRWLRRWRRGRRSRPFRFSGSPGSSGRPSTCTRWT